MITIRDDGFGKRITSIRIRYTNYEYLYFYNLRRLLINSKGRVHRTDYFEAYVGIKEAGVYSLDYMLE